MAKYDKDGLAQEILKFLNEADSKKGELDSTREANNENASKDLADKYLSSVDNNGYVRCVDIINEKTGNTGIRLGRPIGRGGQKLVCEGIIDDFDALNYYPFFVNILKHDLRTNNGGGKLDDLRFKYVVEAEDEAERLMRRGQHDRIKSDAKSVLVSKFPKGICAVGISTSDSAPIKTVMARSEGLDGLVKDFLVYNAVRGNSDDGRVIQIAEYVENIISPNDIHNKLSAYDVVEILRQSLEGLCFFQEIGVIHRDIKPDNIFVVKGKRKIRAKIADLDLMKKEDDDNDDSLTKTREKRFVGSPHYASPEHWEDNLHLDIAADICCLGLTAYKWLTGREPLYYDSNWAKKKQEVRRKLMRGQIVDRADPPVKPFVVDGRATFGEAKLYQIFEKNRLANLETDFEKILAKMIVPDKPRRYQEPAEVLADLDRLIKGENIHIGFNVNHVFGTSRRDIPVDLSYRVKRWVY